MSDYSWDNYLDFVKHCPPRREDVAFFGSLEWTRLHASDRYTPVPFISRLVKKDNTDKFYNKVINSENTIPHALGYIRIEEDWKQRLQDISEDKRSEASLLSLEHSRADFMLSVDLQTDLSGFNNTAHGGFLGALFDEAMGACVEQFRQTLTKRTTSLFTAGLNISFRAPVDLPQVCVLKIWLERRDGRKWYLKGQLIGQDGKVKTEATSIWISVREAGSL